MPIYMPERHDGDEVLHLQRRFRELGRLRMGAVRVTKGKSHPVKLNTWRLTSQGEGGRSLLKHVGVIYGGTVEKWDREGIEGEHWQITTESSSLRIAVPPGEVLTQWFELWSGGGCKRRCDGRRQVLRDVNCSCPSDLNERKEKATKGQACSPATRLSVMLPEIPDLGVWRLETHGYNAAEEIAGTFEILRVAAEGGKVIPARLSIQHRTAKREGKPPSKFTVPVLELDVAIAQVLDALPQLGEGSARREGMMLAPIEAKALPGAPPPLSTDGGREVLQGTIEQASFPGTVEVPAPGAPPDSGIPDWVMALPGTDWEICEVANMLVQERGGDVVIEQLVDLADVPADFRAALEHRMGGGS